MRVAVAVAVFIYVVPIDCWRPIRTSIFIVVFVFGTRDVWMCLWNESKHLRLLDSNHKSEYIEPSLWIVVEAVRNHQIHLIDILFLGGR